MANLNYKEKHNQVGILQKLLGCEDFHPMVDFINSTKLRYALTHDPIIYDSLVRQFWGTASVILDGKQIRAYIDNREVNITEGTVRNKLRLEDDGGINNLPNPDIFQGLTAIGYKCDGTLTFIKRDFSPQWRYLIHIILHCLSKKSGSADQFASPIATALICLSKGTVYNFSKMIFDSMVENVGSRSKFLMYPRFLQMILEITPVLKTPHKIHHVTPKVFSYLKRNFEGQIVALPPAMLVAATNAEGDAIPDRQEIDALDSNTALNSSVEPNILQNDVASASTRCNQVDRPVRDEPMNEPPSPPVRATTTSTPMSFETPNPDLHTQSNEGQSTEVQVLKDELTATTKKYGKLFRRLRKKVKTLENSMARKRKRIVLSDSEPEMSDQHKSDRKRPTAPNRLLSLAETLIQNELQNSCNVGSFRDMHGGLDGTTSLYESNISSQVFADTAVNDFIQTPSNFVQDGYNGYGISDGLDGHVNSFDDVNDIQFSVYTDIEENVADRGMTDNLKGIPAHVNSGNEGLDGLDLECPAQTSFEASVSAASQLEGPLQTEESNYETDCGLDMLTETSITAPKPPAGSGQHEVSNAEPDVVSDKLAGPSISTAMPPASSVQTEQSFSGNDTTRDASISAPVPPAGFDIYVDASAESPFSAAIPLASSVQTEQSVSGKDSTRDASFSAPIPPAGCAKTTDSVAETEKTANVNEIAAQAKSDITRTEGSGFDIYVDASAESPFSAAIPLASSVQTEQSVSGKDSTRDASFSAPIPPAGCAKTTDSVAETEKTANVNEIAAQAKSVNEGWDGSCFESSVKAVAELPVSAAMPPIGSVQTGPSVSGKVLTDNVKGTPAHDETGNERLDGLDLECPSQTSFEASVSAASQHAGPLQTEESNYETDCGLDMLTETSFTAPKPPAGSGQHEVSNAEPNVVSDKLAGPSISTATCPTKEEDSTETSAVKELNVERNLEGSDTLMMGCSAEQPVVGICVTVGEDICAATKSIISEPTVEVESCDLVGGDSDNNGAGVPPTKQNETHQEQERKSLELIQKLLYEEEVEIERKKMQEIQDGICAGNWVNKAEPDQQTESELRELANHFTCPEWDDLVSRAEACPHLAALLNVSRNGMKVKEKTNRPITRPKLRVYMRTYLNNQKVMSMSKSRDLPDKDLVHLYKLWHKKNKECKPVGTEVIKKRPGKNIGAVAKPYKMFTRKTKLGVMEKTELRMLLKIVPRDLSTVCTHLADQIVSEDDDFWKTQLHWKVVSWKLHLSSRVHSIRTNTGLTINMLLGKKYPLELDTLFGMLDAKLETEKESTIAFELIKMVQLQCREKADNAGVDKQDKIVNVKIVPRGDILVAYHLTRQSGFEEKFLNVPAIFRKLSRLDLYEMYEVLKETIGQNKEPNLYAVALYQDLRIMIDTTTEDPFWRMRIIPIVKSWTYFDSCGVHCVKFDSRSIYMLVGQKYPLSPFLCKEMLAVGLIGQNDNLYFQILQQIEAQATGQI